MPSREISKNMPQISACRVGINALAVDPSDLATVTSCHAGFAATVLRSSISVAIASRTAGRACMRAR
jgi:hypothetical protein